MASEQTTNKEKQLKEEKKRLEARLKKLEETVGAGDIDSLTKLAEKMEAKKEKSQLPKKEEEKPIPPGAVPETSEPAPEIEATNKPIEDESVVLSEQEQLAELLDDMPMDNMEDNKKLYAYLLKESTNFPDVIEFAKRQSEKIVKIEELQAKLALKEDVETPATEETQETPVINETQNIETVEDAGDTKEQPPEETEEEKIAKINENLQKAYGGTNENPNPENTPNITPENKESIPTFTEQDISNEKYNKIKTTLNGDYGINIFKYKKRGGILWLSKKSFYDVNLFGNTKDENLGYLIISEPKTFSTSEKAIKEANSLLKKLWEEDEHKEKNLEQQAGENIPAEEKRTDEQLFNDGAKLVVEFGQCSVSLIQRKFGIGYSEAIGIIAQLKAVGIVGPSNDTTQGEILINDLPSLEEHLKKVQINETWTTLKEKVADIEKRRESEIYDEAMFTKALIGDTYSLDVATHEPDGRITWKTYTTKVISNENGEIKFDNGLANKDVSAFMNLTRKKEIDIKYDAELAELAKTLESQENKNTEKNKTEVIVEGIVFKNPTIYSIPNLDGNFDKIHANPDKERQLCVIDENGNVGLLTNNPELTAPRIINHYDSYLKPLWNVPNATMDNSKFTGIKIIKLAKVNSEGNRVEKGEIYFTESGKIEYALGEKEEDKNDTLNLEAEKTNIEKRREEELKIPDYTVARENAIELLSKYEDSSYRGWGKTSAYPDSAMLQSLIDDSKKIPTEERRKAYYDLTAAEKGVRSQWNLEEINAKYDAELAELAKNLGENK